MNGLHLSAKAMSLKIKVNLLTYQLHYDNTNPLILLHHFDLFDHQHNFYIKLF